MSNRETRLNDGEGLDIAHPEDFGIVRNDRGEIQPKKQRIPGTDRAIKVIPLVDGKVEEYDDVFESDNAEDERVSELFESHIVEGIGADGDLSKIPDYVVPGLVQALKNSSGHEVFRAVEDQEMEQNLGMMQAMMDEEGSDMMRTLIEAGKDELDEDEQEDLEELTSQMDA